MPLIHVLAAVVAVTAQPVSAHATHLDGPVAAPMDLDFEKPSVRVTINGQGPYRFLLDTGASPPLVINDDLVKELGLELGEAGRVGDPMNPEAIETHSVAIGSVGIGGARFDDVEAITWDRSALYPGKDAPRGIVGFSLFKDTLLTLDYPGGRILIEEGELPEPDGAGVVEFDAQDGVLSVTIHVAGREVEAHIDSGSMAALTLPRSLVETLPTVGEPVAVGVARTVNSEFEVSEVVLDGAVTFGPLRLDRPTVVTNDMLPMANIGSGVLRGCSLTFDQVNQRLKIVPAAGEGVASKPVRKRYGVMLGMNPSTGETTIAGTTPESPAAHAGLREGDIVIAINGTPAAEVSAPARAAAFREPEIVLTIDRDGERLEVSMSLDD
ncbi:MAG: aspartyl protease family protein [Phycisphaerales bacterium]|nr:aspartyl protease family protein [Phycisphaerales bacterium]MCB9835271.1 aspartyl protease family protein [Phycisphaera sp.]